MYIPTCQKSYIDDPVGTRTLVDMGECPDSVSTDASSDVGDVTDEVYLLRRTVRELAERIKTIEQHIVDMHKAMHILSARRQATPVYKTRTVLPMSNLRQSNVDEFDSVIDDVIDDTHNVPDQEPMVNIELSGCQMLFTDTNDTSGSQRVPDDVGDGDGNSDGNGTGTGDRDRDGDPGDVMDDMEDDESGDIIFADQSGTNHDYGPLDDEYHVDF